MSDLYAKKEQEVLDTPLVLFECRLANGSLECWSTHSVSHGGKNYRGRVLRHNVFELRLNMDEASEPGSKVSLTLANADAYFSQIDAATGWKGALLTARFLFYDLGAGTATSNERVIFQGVASGVEEITEKEIRLAFHNRLNSSRLYLPRLRVQRRCPWHFPATLAQRQEAKDGGSRGRYSAFYACGYSPDVTGGSGNLNGTQPFVSCGYTRADCEARGMFRQDGSGAATGRFGGIEFLPSGATLRLFGDAESGVFWSLRPTRYNDTVPLIYGTGWSEALVILTSNDGQETWLEALVGQGPIQGVQKVIFNGVEIPAYEDGREMRGTGWYKLVSTGERNGVINPDLPGGGQSGLPYGSMAYLSLRVPKEIAAARATPQLQVLVDGQKLPRYDAAGAYLGDFFTNNPAWILLDILRRAGWQDSELDLASFGQAAQFCDELVPATDAAGNAIQIPRYRCNLVLRNRRSIGELLRGIKAASGLYVRYGADGRLQLVKEHSLAVQQPAAPAGTNSVMTLNGGWPAYEFGDGSNGFSGILRRANGEPAIRFWTRGATEAPNRLYLEFQDEFNFYQQDSLSLVEVSDVATQGYEIAAAYPALGVTNFHQAARLLERQLKRNIQGNLFVELETTVKGIGLQPGDIITISYARANLNRAPFRILRLLPGVNYETVRIVAQRHDDAWYAEPNLSVGNGTYRPHFFGQAPRALQGTVVDADGAVQFQISEQAIQLSDGKAAIVLRAEFAAPQSPGFLAGTPRLSLAAQVYSTGGEPSGRTDLLLRIDGSRRARQRERAVFAGAGAAGRRSKHLPRRA